jgi:hypothetical protein
MRRLLACVIVALAVPAAAGGTSLPPLAGAPKLVRYTPAPAQHRGSCSEQGRSRAAARLTRKLAPVACEQPPKPKLRNTDLGSFFGP